MDPSTPHHHPAATGSNADHSVKKMRFINFYILLGGNPGLVNMVGGLCPEGCRFKSQHSIHDGHFHIYISCKNCNVCLKRQKQTKKVAGDGPIKLLDFFISICIVTNAFGQNQIKAMVLKVSKNSPSTFLDLCSTNLVID